MAKHYQFWFSVEETWTARFTADSLEEAQAMLEQAIDDGSGFAELLPNYIEKNKGLDTVVDETTLEFVGEFED